MDRNQIVGLMLMATLILVYLQFFAPEQPIPNNSPSTEKTVKDKDTTKATEVTAEASQLPDSILIQQYGQQYGVLAKNAVGKAEEIILENKDVKVYLNTKGGSISKVLLKNYLTFDKKPLYLIDGESDRMVFEIPTKNGAVNINNLYFSTTSSSQNVAEKDSGRISFKVEIEAGKFIEKTYTLPGSGFQVFSSFRAQGLQDLLENKDLKLTWITDVKKVERDVEPTRISTTVNYYTTEGEFKNLSESSKDPEEERFTTPVKWVAMKERFFTAAIIMENEPFSSGIVKSNVDEKDSNLVKHLEAHLVLPASVLKDGFTEFKYYFGPNNYQIAKKVTEGFGNNVYLGWAIFSTINKYLVIPIFNFLQNYISNYGIIILILVLIIKLILFPLSYKSHISLAKTKALKPELDEIKAKYGDDMQKVQAEQMQLYSKVGVNPLSGCIPMLLQMPIFLALYNFFPNSIELRQESLLWADDLSTYDSIASLPFYIPAYGDHISLFCILMTISTLVYTWFNNQVTTVTGPMKSMQYMMPVVFLFFFNSLAAGLTYYYFINNLLTIFQQVAFRAFVDEDKIRQKLDENKVKNQNKKKSKFQQKLEDAMKQAETAKKVSDSKKKR